jgi:fatty acyl-CoA reductase
MVKFEENFLNFKPPVLPEELKHIPDRVGETFVGKTLFITGGSGFLGKVLVEKLLRKCPGIERIYLLLRPKKGSHPKQRLETIFSSVVSLLYHYLIFNQIFRNHYYILIIFINVTISTIL